MTLCQRAFRLNSQKSHKMKKRPSEKNRVDRKKFFQYVIGYLESALTFCNTSSSSRKFYVFSAEISLKLLWGFTDALDWSRFDKMAVLRQDTVPQAHSSLASFQWHMCSFSKSPLSKRQPGKRCSTNFRQTSLETWYYCCHPQYWCINDAELQVSVLASLSLQPR